MAGGWQPDAAVLQQTAQLLQSSASPSPDVQVRMQVQQQLQAAEASPDFACYLAYVFASDSDVTLRSLAALALTKLIESKAGPVTQRRPRWPMLPQLVRQFVKPVVLSLLACPEPALRRYAGYSIAAIAYHVASVDPSSRQPLDTWPELMPGLLQGLQAGGDVAIGVLSCLVAMCEERIVREYLDSPRAADRPLNALVPVLLQYTSAEDAAMRRPALTVLASFLTEMPAALLTNMSVFLETLMRLAVDRDDKVRQRVCEAMTDLVHSRYDLIESGIDSIVSYMVDRVQEQEDKVAIAALDFVIELTYVDRDRNSGDPGGAIARAVLPKYLPSLLTSITQRARYDDFSIAEMEAEEERAGAAVPDRDQDVAPINYRGKRGSGGSGDDDDRNASGSSSAWSMRQECGLASQELSRVFGDELVDLYLPLISQLLSDQSEDWTVRESGVLLLGAIAQNCMTGLEPHFAQLLPYLLTLMDDASPFVRVTTCWTLGRFSPYYVNSSEETAHHMLSAFLSRMNDPSKTVQHAACSAYSELIEELRDLDAPSKLAAHLPQIAGILAQAVQVYQRRNLASLCDAISTTSLTMAMFMTDAGVLDVLAPALLQRWSQTPDWSNEFIALAEALQSLVSAVGLAFAPYVEQVWARCVSVCEQCILLWATADERGEYPPSIQFESVAIDTIGYIVETFDSQVEPLISNSNIMQLLLSVIGNDEHDGPREAAFGVLGDLCGSVYVHVEPHLQAILTAVARAVHPDGHESMVNNAMFCAAQALSAMPTAAASAVVPSLLAVVKPVMARPQVPVQLLETGAGLLGSLAAHAPQLVAAELSDLFTSWSLGVAMAVSPQERVTGLRGLLQACQLNTQPSVDNVAFLVSMAMYVFNNIDDSLQTSLLQLLHHAYGKLGPNQFWAHVPVDRQEGARALFGL